MKQAAVRYTFADLVAAAQAIDAVDRMKAELAEFAADFLGGDDAGVINFLDISTGDAFDVSPVEAMEYFKGKGLRPSFSYADMLGRSHDQAFTVAKMLDVDLLKQVRDSLDSALANGESFGAWKKEIGPILKAAGWWGNSPMPDPITGDIVEARLGSAWRLETIFRTNLQTAYAAGQWQQIQDQADVAPFLMYDAIDDFRTRDAHRAWDGTVLPVRSAWWRTHYPPNGWNCRCSVIQLDADQLADLGITPRDDAPPTELVPWTNPRTGEVLYVPKGLDPGFDRNAGDMVGADLRQLLREKVDNLPRDMQDAVAPVLRREFDADTAAGRWHRQSFDAAPPWLREKALDMQAVRVEMESKTQAFARGGSLIDMDGKRADDAVGQSVWRHEFGHIMDARLAMTDAYRSAQADFVTAQKKDADALAVVAGNGRKSKANDARRAAALAAYDKARDTVIDTPGEARAALLRDMATAAGLDFEKFLGVVRESTKILDDGVELAGVGASVRAARMIEAARLGDGEGFLRWASYMDDLAAHSASRTYDLDLIKLHGASWRKDGSLASLSDLIGSATRNKAASFNNGFPGHSDSYYKKAPWFPTTESFANLASLAGHPNAYWWELAKRFAPGMAELFRQIIEGTA